jgi:hypothetical protein
VVQRARDDYETHVRQPMTAIVERLADDSARSRGAGSEPEGLDVSHLPRYEVLRQQDAVQDPRRRRFPTRGLLKYEGAGVYSASHPTKSGSAGGICSPQPAQLYAVREHIAGHSRQLRAILESPGFRRQVTARRRDAEARAARVPMITRRPSLKHRHFIAGAEFPQRSPPVRSSTARS